MRATQFIRQNGWAEALVPVTFILAFGVAAGNHVIDIARGGLFPYARWYGAPESLNVFWTSLTLLDPLAVLVLLYHVRAGYLVGLGIMFADVPVNVHASIHYWKLPLYQNTSLIMQTAFLMFLLVTVRRVWRLSSGKMVGRI